MADAPPKPVDQFASTETPAEHDETNWGDDWESAFQAEDDTFFSKEKEEEFFLEENEPTVTAAAAAKGLDSSLEKTLSGIPDQSSVVSDTRPTKAFVLVGAITSLFLSGKTAAQKQFARLQSFPIFIRIPLYALPVLLIISLLLLLGAPKSRHAASPSATSVAPQQTTAPSPEAVNQASQLHPGKVRKKWAFPAFIIPVNNDAGDQPVTFVLVDITLIASLDEQEDPPADKKIFVRDIIYQFYQNKPLEELRRFSLARGDMNRELRAWLQKQWPEAPIESIIFHQYHLS
ncbi:MAG: flagellar basal body-associated FliL family protein [Desulfobulbaceae bacterium]|nr:flagellar basal body-associated FliL family protein [Desulfobulbaceae bacterium]HIJ91565.1 flagellar basal body-associated FliL family protein [Deltaproteobacteria bacterium]